MLKLSKRQKILIGLVVYIPFLMVVTMLFGFVEQWLNFSNLLNYELFNMAGILAGTYLFVRFWDKRPFASFGLSIGRMKPHILIAGVLFPAVLMSIVFATHITFNLASVDRFGQAIQTQYPDLPTLVETEKEQNNMSPEETATRLEMEKATVALPMGLLLSIAVFLIGAVTEEVLTRGYILQNIERGFGTRSALIASSAVFCIFHLLTAGLFDPQNTMFAINLFLIGLLFGYAYLLTRSLWLPIVLHFSWNFFQGPIFGFSVSGAHHSPELFQLIVTGPMILTGGERGPEGGLLVTVILVLILGLIYQMRLRERLMTLRPSG